MDELLRYDVVVLGDVHPDRIGGLALVERFVVDHGRGLIVIAGPHERIGDALLPVVPARRPPLEPGYEGYRVTEEGRNHSIIRVCDWAKLPPVFAVQPVERVKPSASVLVEVAGAPLFVTAHAGTGRVFWSATDETWRWRRLAGDSPWFAPFWRHAIEWCRNVRGRGDRLRLRVERDDARYALGEPVRFFATAFDERWEPLKDDTLSIDVERDSVVLRRGDRDGHFTGTWTPPRPGLYRALDESFVVNAPVTEEDDPLDAETMRAIAKASQGTFAQLSGAVAALDALPDARYVLVEGREDDLWDSPAVFLLFALIITAEWIVRKALRMP